MPYIGNDIQFGELTSQTFTGDGSTVAFTMGYSVANTTSILVTSGNVVQEPTVAYTVSGTTLTFTSAPEDDDTIHVRFLGRVVDVANAAILQDSDQDTKIQVEESADEDTIRFDIAGAEDFTMTANDFTALSGSTISTNTIAETTSGSGVTIDGLLIKDGAVNNVAGKNLIRNGSMAIAQRDSQAGMASGYGACDGWQLMSLSGAPARYTISQESSGGVGGNSKWNKILVTTADANPAAADTHYYGQKMEGNSVQTLLDSSGDLQACTMSFDVLVHADGASSISFPATLVIFVNDHGFDGQQYAKTFTVTSNDTWQRVSVPIAANTNIVINNDTSDEFSVGVTIYAGSGKVISDATWGSAAGLDTSVSGAENLADVVNNYLGLTNVQLEVGSVATDFEHEAISVTLAKCVRYFERFQPSTTSGFICAGSTTASTTGEAFLPYVEKRGTPTVTLSADGTFSHLDGGGTGRAVSSAAVSLIDVKGCRIAYTIASGAAGGGALIRDSTDTTTIDITAEL